MSASDHLSGIQFRSNTRRSANGVRATTIRAYEGERNTGYAKLTDGERTLDTLNVRPEDRGRGLGHAIMNEVISRYGDRTLRLRARAFGKGDGPTGQNLQDFYAKHGFEPESDGGYMVRRPQQSGP